MENILIVADMEGCIDLFDLNDQQNCLTLMQKEVEAVILELQHENKYVISVLDCHNNGLNLLPLSVKYNNIEFIRHVWNFDYKKKYDFAIFIGFHAKNEADGFSSHTFRNDFFYVTLGNKVVGELELLINWLSKYNIPTVFVSGDEAAIKEASHLKCHGFAVKSSKIDDANHISYTQLTTQIKKAIISDRPAINYIDSEVKIKFINDDFLDYLPEHDYCKQNKMVVFENTITFIESLFELSILLNAINEVSIIKLNKLNRKIKEFYSLTELEKLEDEKINEIFSLKSKLHVTKNHRDYLIKRLDIK